MDLEFIILSEVKQRKTNIICYHLYVECKKNDTHKLIYKTETDSQTEKIFEEIIVEKFPNMGKEIVNQVQQVQREIGRASCRERV